jgi:transcriptional regulator with XRE-family HTH domain
MGTRATIGADEEPKLDLRAWRDHFGLVQKQLADKMQCDESVISDREKGKQPARLGYLVLLAKALGLPDYRMLLWPPSAAMGTPLWVVLGQLSEAERDVLMATANGLLKARREEAPNPRKDPVPRTSALPLSRPRSVISGKR